MTKVTIKNAPKTLRDSLKRALTFIKKKKSVKNIYSDNLGNSCLIGSYFTPEQREWIKTKDLNESNIAHVSQKIGRRNLLAMTGMNADQCSVLQNDFDSGDSNFLFASIKGVLAGDRDKISGVRFKL